VLRHQQLLVDLWPEDGELLERVQPLWTVTLEAAEASGATILSECSHQFEPSGFTGLALLSQSHLSVHTWVEQRLLLLDVQSCGSMRPQVIVDRLAAFLHPCSVEQRAFERGRRGDEARGR